MEGGRKGMGGGMLGEIRGEGGKNRRWEAR